MRIAVTGSIATDHLMVFPGRFADQFVTELMDKVSLSFLVDKLDIRRGGAAANIAFGLGCLGQNPVLLGGVGADFDDYRRWLERHGVDTESVYVSQTQHTARFLCTTDDDQNQIASFYSGAMAEARNIDLRHVADRVGELDLVLVAPNDPAAMVRHTVECRTLGYRFAADPSQQLARMAGDEIRSLVDGAALLFTNEYEHGLLLRSTEWLHAEVLERVGTWITTLGSDGVQIEGHHQPTIRVPAVAVRTAVDPTGVGDAFRAGFLAGLAWELDIERAAQLGCTVATVVLETVGCQEYQLDHDDLLKRFEHAYGASSAADVEARIRAIPSSAGEVRVSR